LATRANKLPDDLRDIVQPLGRKALHAANLGLEPPATGEEMFFEAPLPDDLAALENALDSYDLSRPGVGT